MRVSGSDSDFRWFDFRKTVVSDVIRIRWRIDDSIVVIPASTAIFAIERKYAKHVTDQQISDWNAMIDELDLDAPSPAPVPIEDNADLTPIPETPETPAGEPEQLPAPTEPVEPESASEGQENATEQVVEPAEAETAEETSTEAEDKETQKSGRKGKAKADETKGLL